MRIELHADETLLALHRMTGRAIWVMGGVLLLMGLSNGDGGFWRILDVVFFGGILVGIVFAFRHFVLREMLLHWVESQEYRHHFTVVGVQFLATPILLFLPVAFELKFIVVAAMMLSHALACDAWLRGTDVRFIMRPSEYDGSLDQQNLVESAAVLNRSGPFSPALSILKYGGMVLAVVAFTWLSGKFADEPFDSTDGLPGVALALLLVMTGIYARRRARVIDAVTALALARPAFAGWVGEATAKATRTPPQAESVVIEGATDNLAPDDDEEDGLDDDEEDGLEIDEEFEALSDDEKALHRARIREYVASRVAPLAEWLVSVEDLVADPRFLAENSQGGWGRQKLTDLLRQGEKWGYDWRTVYRQLKPKLTHDRLHLPPLEEMEKEVAGAAPPA